MCTQDFDSRRWWSVKCVEGDNATNLFNKSSDREKTLLSLELLSVTRCGFSLLTVHQEVKNENVWNHTQPIPVFRHVIGVILTKCQDATILAIRSFLLRHALLLVLLIACTHCILLDNVRTFNPGVMPTRTGREGDTVRTNQLQRLWWGTGNALWLTIRATMCEIHIPSGRVM